MADKQPDVASSGEPFREIGEVVAVYQDASGTVSSYDVQIGDRRDIDGTLTPYAKIQAVDGLQLRVGDHAEVIHEQFPRAGRAMPMILGKAPHAATGGGGDPVKSYRDIGWLSSGYDGLRQRCNPGAGVPAALVPDVGWDVLAPSVLFTNFPNPCAVIAKTLIIPYFKAYSTETGALLWTAAGSSNDQIYATETHLYMADTSRARKSLLSDGSLVWSTSTGGGSAEVVIALDEERLILVVAQVFSTSQNFQRIDCYNSETGALKWSLNITPEASAVVRGSAPGILYYDGVIFFAYTVTGADVCVDWPPGFDTVNYPPCFVTASNVTLKVCRVNALTGAIKGVSTVRTQDLNSWATGWAVVDKKATLLYRTMTKEIKALWITSNGPPPLYLWDILEKYKLYVAAVATDGTVTTGLVGTYEDWDANALPDRGLLPSPEIVGGTAQGHLLVRHASQAAFTDTGYTVYSGGSHTTSFISKSYPAIPARIVAYKSLEEAWRFEQTPPTGTTYTFFRVSTGALQGVILRTGGGDALMRFTIATGAISSAVVSLATGSVNDSTFRKEDLMLFGTAAYYVASNKKVRRII